MMTSLYNLSRYLLITMKKICLNKMKENNREDENYE